MTVYLVGAGPGDPGLLTVRGAEVMASADVVIYDRLSVGALLDLAPVGAERISVGKRPGQPGPSQERINRLLIEHGRSAGTVVRLKGGDPFVFARGGEEAQALLEAGVPFEVVPGVSSALAAPAYAGIPVTMRYSSTAVTVVTGHEDPTKEHGSVDWEAIARAGGTIVVLMGVARWSQIATRLIAGGLAPDTPAAAVQWGTRPEQRTVRATIATLGDAHLEAPSAIVVGDVAAIDLAWFESKPLFGKRVVVTRARAQASSLADKLARHGAAVVEVPTIAFEEPADGGAARRAAAERVGSYDWLILTSVNGVERFCAELRDARALGGVKVAAIGPGTAAALAERNIAADLVPERFVAEALLEEFPQGPGRVLMARAAVARDVLPDGLRERWWEVDVVDAYRTVAPEITTSQRDAVRTADIVTFTSSSTVARFVELLGVRAVPPVVACIGPVTAATARDLGLDVDVEASVHTIDGLVAAVVGFVPSRQ